MPSCHFSNAARRALLLCAVLTLRGPARAETPLPPPARASQRLPESVALPSSRAPEPSPETDAIKVRVHGEYELRQSVLTAIPLAPVADAPAELAQRSRLFHWLRLRPLLLVGTHYELRAEADVPRGMIYGGEPSAVPDNGTDFDRQQPLRVQARMLRLTARASFGELQLGHTTVGFGMGLRDNTGDEPRAFGTPDRAATYERLLIMSGGDRSPLRVGALADVAYEDGRISFVDGDRLYRAGLTARYAPTSRIDLALLARYESLARRDDLAGAELFVFDLAGGFRAPLPGRAGELFGQYEVVYEVGDADERAAFASAGNQRAVTTLAAAARLGVALEETRAGRRFAPLVAWLEWGTASGDADPSDDELHRFVMRSNHGVGLLLFSELLRFKTSRAQAALAAVDGAAGEARLFGLATAGGVAGASYLNPVLLLRPLPELALKLGLVVASASTSVVDPSALASRGARQNFDGGPPRGRSLGSEFDFGGELAFPLERPMQLRLSLEAGLAFPGSAFEDASGNRPGTQAIATTGLGLTF